MKKTILLAFLALALPASAGSIDWQLNTMGTANYMVDQNGNKLTGTAYLVLTDEFENATISTLDDITDLALGGSSGSLAIANGVNKTLATSTDSRIKPVDGSTLLSFTVLIYDSVNNAFYKTVEKTQTAYNLTGEELTDAKQISYSAAQLYSTSTTRGTQQWVSVPEPSTAALALAGLALLLKRRRA